MYSHRRIEAVAPVISGHMLKNARRKSSRLRKSTVEWTVKLSFLGKHEKIIETNLWKGYHQNTAMAELNSTVSTILDYLTMLTNTSEIQALNATLSQGVSTDTSTSAWVESSSSSAVTAEYSMLAETTTLASTTSHAYVIDNQSRYLSEWLKTGHPLLQNHHNIYILYSVFGVVFLVFFIFLCWTQCCVSVKYQRLPTSPNEKSKPRLYKPSQGGLLDEEYENTFVGVSVPLLQEVTKI